MTMMGEAIAEVMTEVTPGDLLINGNTTVSPDDNNIPFLNITASDNMILQNVVISLNKYGLPAIILVGIVGNSLSLVVFLASHLRYQSSSIYLAFLNVVDIIFLLCLSPIWLGWLNVYLIHKNGWCQMIVYLSYVSAFLSVWTVVSFTVERFLVVYYPLQRHEYCTRRRSIVVIVLLTCFSLILYSFSLWTTGLLRVRKNNVCLTLPRYEPLLRIVTAIDTFITLGVPSILIIVFNILIGIKVWRFLHFSDANLHTEQTELMQGCRGNEEPVPGTSSGSGRSKEKPRSFSRSSSSRQGNRTTQIRRHQSQSLARQSTIQLRTTRTLLIISSIFVILNLPSHAFRVSVTVRYLTSESVIVFSRTMLLWQQVFQLLYYANFSTNFFLYCSYSRTFRAALRRLTARLKRKFQRRLDSMPVRIRINRVPDPSYPRIIAK